MRGDIRRTLRLIAMAGLTDFSFETGVQLAQNLFVQQQL